jgi:hypothetical protein
MLRLPHCAGMMLGPLSHMPLGLCLDAAPCNEVAQYFLNIAFLPPLGKRFELCLLIFTGLDLWIQK